MEFCWPDTKIKLLINPISGSYLLEALPDKFFDWQVDGPMKNVEAKYNSLLRQTFVWDKNLHGWGFITDHTPISYRKFVCQERQAIKHLIPKNTKTILDVSAGVGNYTLYIAQFFPKVTHCEAEVGALNQAIHQASANMSFVRASYLQLPFVDNSFDVTICTDTLIRGGRHDHQLLKEILRVTKNVAIIDFHRRHLLQKNNSDVICYNFKEISQLIKSPFYIQKIDYRPFFTRRYLVTIKK